MQFAEDAKKEKKFAKFCPKTVARTVLLDRRFFEGGTFLQKRRKREMEAKRAASIRACIFIYGSRNDAK